MSEHLTRGTDGACLDCGAERVEIDDNLAPTCDKVVGPHRLGIMAMRRDLRRLDRQIVQMRRMEDRFASSAIEMHNEIPAVEAERDALLVSIDTLENPD